MILEVQGYKWQSEQGSKSAEQIAKNFYGLPKQEDYVTKEAFKAVKNEGSEGVFWYHIGSLEPLGSIKTFTINT